MYLSSVFVSYQYPFVITNITKSKNQASDKNLQPTLNLRRFCHFVDLNLFET